MTTKKIINTIIFIIIVVLSFLWIRYTIKRYDYVNNISKVKELKNKNLYHIDFMRDEEYDPYEFDLYKAKKYLDTIYDSNLEIYGQFAFTDHIINGLPIPDEIYMNYNQFKISSINVSKGNGLNEYDFIYDSKKEIPILVGKDFLYKYNLGEIYDINILGQSQLVKVVGVIDKNQYHINMLDLFIDLDKAIIIPMDKNFIDKFLTEPDMIEMFITNSMFKGNELDFKKLSWSEEENGIYDARFVSLDNSINDWEQNYYNRTRNFLILEIFIILILFSVGFVFFKKILKNNLF